MSTLQSFFFKDVIQQNFKVETQEDFEMAYGLKKKDTSESPSIIQEEKLQININSCISLKPFIHLIV